MTRKMMLGLAMALGMAGVAALPACANEAATRKAEAKEKEENEVKMKLSECPAAVQATLTKETAGATIKDVDKETDDGKVVYETDVTIGGKEYEVKVAEDGTLISKKLDDEKEEGKGEKEEKEEKGEHGEKK